MTPEELRMLRKIREEQPAGSVRLPEKEPADELQLFRVNYKAAPRRGFTYTSVVTTSRFEKGRVAEIRLHAVDLNYAARGADRGVPKLAAPDVAKTILERLQRLSEPYGTRITIDQGVGVIRLPAEGSASSQR